MPRPFLISLWLAAVVSAGALLLASGPAPGAWVSPFVTPGVIVVHVLTALPLAALLAMCIPPGRAWAWGAVGLTVAGLTVWAGGGLAVWLEGTEAAFAARAAVRLLWGVALLLPWCAAGAAWGRPAQPRPDWGAVALAAGVAALVPAAYAAEAAQAWTAQWAKAGEENKVAEEALLAERLFQLGWGLAPDGKTPVARGRALLARQVEELRSQADDQRLPAERRAAALAQLGRPTEAAAQLRRLPRGAPSSDLLLATVLSEQGQLDESDELFRATVDAQKGALRLSSQSGGKAAGYVLRAIDGLAYNARRRNNFEGAARFYREGIDMLPQAEAYFQFQLGLNWAAGDHPGRAMEHFSEATRLDPKGYGEKARPHIGKLRREAPGCIFPAGGPGR